MSGRRHKFPMRCGPRSAEACENGCGVSREPRGIGAWVYRHPTDPRWPGGTAPPCERVPCPRCQSTDTEPLRNYGRPVHGRFECHGCRRWFGPENPIDAGGCGVPGQPSVGERWEFDSGIGWRPAIITWRDGASFRYKCTDRFGGMGQREVSNLDGWRRALPTEAP